jgi:hypothetical protein
MADANAHAPQDAELAAFQAALLDLLSQGLSAPQVIEQLQADPRFADLRGYISTFEPRMVEVAIALVAKWGQRDGGVPAPSPRST